MRENDRYHNLNRQRHPEEPVKVRVPRAQRPQRPPNRPEPLSLATLILSFLAVAGVFVGLIFIAQWISAWLR